jgi:hypothetical protein
LQAMQSGVERTLLHLQRVARYLLDALRDGVAVDGSERDHPKDQEVEGSLRKIELGSRVHAYRFYIYASIGRSARCCEMREFDIPQNRRTEQ